MSPRTADPALRTTLLETAARLIADEGREGLTLRRLANEVGSSTMAVYTHFGGMDELCHEVRVEGFKRFAAFLDGVVLSRDPVFDVCRLGWAYARNALTNPNLYRVMFLEPWPAEADPVGSSTFDTLVRAVDRCAQEGRFGPGDAVERARQVWSLAHGAVSLYLAHLLTFEELAETMSSGAANLFVGFGDTPAAIRRSMRKMRRAGGA